MRIILGARQTGKTADAIKRSNETGYPIVCADINDARNIGDVAKSTGQEVPETLVYGVNPIENRTSVIIDDVYKILFSALGVDIDTITATTDEVEHDYQQLPKKIQVSSMYGEFGKGSKWNK